LIPLYELSAHALIVSRVPAWSDYQSAGDFIRSELAEADVIEAAPGFIDPIVRWQLGDRMPLAMAGRSDMAHYERAWVVSIRGAHPRDVPAQAQSELARDFGHVRVERYRLGKSPVLYDFVSEWPRAQASVQHGERSEPCPLHKGGFARGGGLGRGALLPIGKRFECDARNPRLFVGDVVLEDLDNEPRHCIWQHPQGPEPVTLTFHDVPLGAALVFYGSLYYEDERMRQGAEVTASIAIAGQARARFVHKDGDGLRSLSIDTSGLGERAEVSIAVTTPNPQNRSFCWSATTRSAGEASR
jgi:hypothetical protein